MTSDAPTPPVTVPPPTEMVPAVLAEWPDGFATHYQLSFDPPFEDEPFTGAGLTDAFMFRERVTLAGPRGPDGSGVLSGIDYRPIGDSVECGGKTYVGEPGHDLEGLPGGFEGELKDGTTLSLVSDRQVAVYVGNSFPNCFEQYGTYTVTFLTDGQPRVKTGRYAWLDNFLDFD